MRTGIGKFFLAVTAWITFAAASFGQTFGQLTGLVTDSSRGVLVGAAVTVTNPQTSFTRTESKNTSGLYTFTNLLPDVYIQYCLVESAGTQALVLALVNWPTLNERTAAGPMPLEEVFIFVPSPMVSAEEVVT
jgi:hypothetical protein